MSKQMWPFNPPKPVKHGDRWRIRWVDEKGERKSQVFAEGSDAYLFGIERGLEAERRRLKAPAPEQEADTSTACAMTFAQAAEAWQEQVGYDKRSRKSDESFCAEPRCWRGCVPRSERELTSLVWARSSTGGGAIPFGRGVGQKGRSASSWR